MPWHNIAEWIAGVFWFLGFLLIVFVLGAIGSKREEAKFARSYRAKQRLSNKRFADAAYPNRKGMASGGSKEDYDLADGSESMHGFERW